MLGLHEAGMADGWAVCLVDCRGSGESWEAGKTCVYQGLPFDLILELLADDSIAGVLPDRSEITTEFSENHCVQFLTKGTADFIVEVAQSVAWLTAALRPSPDEDSIRACTPYLEEDLVPPWPYPYSLRCVIGFNMEAETNSGNAPNRCWHGLFRNPVVVKGFPISRRKQVNTGLEIPLHMVAGLANAPRVHDFNGRLCLKGFSAMLVAAELVGDVVLWHLYYNATGGRISYLDMDEDAALGGLNTNILRSSRHVVGWCRDALCMFGKDLPSSYRQQFTGPYISLT